MDSLSYQEALGIVEKFMIDSGIRRYCTKICKEKCCGNCRKKNDQACQHYEKRRLACSIYLCSKIYNILPLISRERWKHVDSCIMEQYNLFDKLLCCRKNAYFTAPPKVFFEMIRFPITVKTELEQVSTNTIKTRIKKLTEKHKKGK